MTSLISLFLQDNGLLKSQSSTSHVHQCFTTCKSSLVETDLQNTWGIWKQFWRPPWVWHRSSSLTTCLLVSVSYRTSLVAVIVKNPLSNAGDLGSILGSGRSPGENDNSLQYSCLGNSMEPGGLQFTGSQRVGHDSASKQQKVSYKGEATSMPLSGL